MNIFRTIASEKHVFREEFVSAVNGGQVRRKLPIKKIVANLFLISLLAISLATHAIASPFQDADEAFERGDYQVSYRILKHLADQGLPEAQHNLAVLCEQRRDISPDYTEAAKWYMKAAEQGLATSQYNLAVAYLLGRGVQKDYTEAIKWYRKAADQRHASAQYNLGLLYAKGEGVQQDLVLAHMWFNLSALLYTDSEYERRTKAIHDRNLAASMMTPKQINKPKQLAQEWKRKMG